MLQAVTYLLFMKKNSGIAALPNKNSRKLWVAHSSPIFWAYLLEYPIWVNYNDLTATSLEIMVSKGNHPQMALIQVSEIL